MSDERPRPRGRGARGNVPNPYERLHVDVAPGALDEEERRSLSIDQFRRLSGGRHSLFGA
ncbi:MAG: hypothetical protein ABEK84_03240 [Salinibacter sp.]